MAVFGSSTGGQITWNLDTDDSKFKRGMASARREASDTADHIDKSSGAFSRLGGIAATAAKAAVVALGAATTAAVGFGVKSAASFEQTRIGLENMLGSADAARDMLAKVSKFAAETPFEFPELAQATRQLVAFGFSGEDAFKTMTQLGDVSAAIGAPIGDLAYLMGTLKAQGRAFMIDIRQFAMRGIPIYEYLAKVFKTNTEEVAKLIEAGKVGFPEVQKAFEMMTAEGGKFHGTMARQSKSLNGLFSTLKDVIGQTGRELVGITAEGDIKAGSLFDKLRQGTARLIEVLPTAIAQMKEIVRDIIPQLKQWADNIRNVAVQIAEYLGPKLNDLWVIVSEKLFPALKKFYDEILAPLVPILGTVLVGAIGAVIDGIAWLLDQLSQIIDFMAENKGVVLALAIAFGTLGTAMALNAVLNSLTLAFNTFMLITVPAMSASLATLGAAFIAALPAAAILLLIGSVIAGLKNLENAWKKTFDEIEGASDNAVAMMESLNKQFKAGEIAADKYKQGLKQAASAAQDASVEARNAKESLSGFSGFLNWATGGARAAGGPVSSGTSYLVGERGPELFTPNSSGTITPNHELGSGGGSFEYHIGTINIASEVDGERWLKKLTRNQEIIDNGLIPSKAAM